MQETLLAVHHQRHTYRTDQPLTAWVHAIARYKLIDWLRAHAVNQALTDPLDDELEIFAASDSETAEAKRAPAKSFGDSPGLVGTALLVW